VPQVVSEQEANSICGSCVLLFAILQDGALDTHDPKASHLRLSFLKKRSKITEIVAAKVCCPS